MRLDELIEAFTVLIIFLNPICQILQCFSQYLNQFINHYVLETDFDLILKRSSFEKLQDLENKGKFKEAVINKSTGNKVNFFNLGPKNDWKKNLKTEISKKIENEFRQEMIELGYL